MKKVYISFALHGNMCYDRYIKQVIREKFPLIYVAGVRAMHRYPEVTAHIDFPGLTALSLKHHAKWFMDELQPLVDRKQVIMAGCQYAASHALCADEESDVVADCLSNNILRDELHCDVSTFWNQEIAFHPQVPYILNKAGVRHLILREYEGWTRPRKIVGMDGSELYLYPIDFSHGKIESLEDLYDSHNDGDFVFTGGDFELLVNIDKMVAELKRLADKGKVIEWTTVERYEQEIGITDVWENPVPYGTALEDTIESPSFSRWVGDPEDIIWHGYAVKATDAIRSAGFAKLIARLYGLGTVDVPLTRSWTAEKDNVWDHYFEHALEYPETEARYLTPDGEPTLLSRAWHHLVIGINSDSSGWYPWTPRTRHRNIVLQNSRALSNEVLVRTAREIAAKIEKPAADTDRFVLALNPAPARSAEIAVDTDAPAAFVDAQRAPVATTATFRDGRWSARARVDLPAYGYKVFGLGKGEPSAVPQWQTGDSVAFGGRTAALTDGILRISEGARELELTVAPFRLSDPSGVAETENVVPTWEHAEMRVRTGPDSAELELFTELAWTVWLRLPIVLRQDRIDVTADVHVDMPRRIGNLRFDPEGLLIYFKGQAGSAFYDIPYGTVQHVNDKASFVAAQRWAALGDKTSSECFALVGLEGNQSFKFIAKDGIIGANLGTSTEGRPDLRPEVEILPDGTAIHHMTSGGDPFFGTYTHRFAVVFGSLSEIAVKSRDLRTAVPVVPVELGGGSWPAEQSLLDIGPENVHVTAFRVSEKAFEIVLNDLSGASNTATCQGASVEMKPYDIVEVAIEA